MTEPKTSVSAMADAVDKATAWDAISEKNAEITRLTAELAAARKALEFIVEGYDNHDVNHLDYRVKVYEVALDALQGQPK